MIHLLVGTYELSRFLFSFISLYYLTTLSLVKIAHVKYFLWHALYEVCESAVFTDAACTRTWGSPLSPRFIDFTGKKVTVVSHNVRITVHKISFIYTTRVVNKRTARLTVICGYHSQWTPATPEALQASCRLYLWLSHTTTY